MILASLVNADALWKIAAVGFGVGAGAVVVWSLAIVGTARLGAARSRGAHATVVSYAFVVSVCGLLFAAALVAGFIAMTHK